MAIETGKDARSVETANGKQEAVSGQTAKKGRKVQQNSIYSASELADNAGKIFGVRRECVAAALRASGKAECTVDEAKEIVKKFLKREVK